MNHDQYSDSFSYLRSLAIAAAKDQLLEESAASAVVGGLKKTGKAVASEKGFKALVGTAATTTVARNAVELNKLRKSDDDKPKTESGEEEDEDSETPKTPKTPKTESMKESYVRPDAKKSSQTPEHTPIHQTLGIAPMPKGVKYSEGWSNALEIPRDESDPYVAMWSQQERANRVVPR